MPTKPRAQSAADNPHTIADYHAHVYYDAERTRDRAERLRARIAAEFPLAKLGRWHDELVGPHPQSMYQVAFPSRLLASFVPWLMLNRDGLAVLLHPETGDDYRDHTAHACWFGATLPLRVDVLRKAAEKACTALIRAATSVCGTGPVPVRYVLIGAIWRNLCKRH